MNLNKHKNIPDVQLKSAYADWYACNSGKAELERLASSNPEQAKNLVDYIRQKPLYLEFSPIELIAASMVLAECGQLPDVWLLEPNPTESALRFFHGGDWDHAFESTEPEKQQIIISMMMAIASNLQSAQIFSKSIFELLCELDGGDDEALFKAVVVDRSALAIPSVQSRVQLAELMADEVFFDKLAKAIKRTRPARPTPVMDDVRAMLYVLSDVGVLALLTNSEITRLFVDELQIYDDDGRADPSAAIAKFVQRFKKARTPKR